MARQIVAYDDLEHFSPSTITPVSDTPASSLPDTGQNTSTSALQTPDVSTHGTHTNSPNIVSHPIIPSSPPTKKRKTADGRSDSDQTHKSMARPKFIKRKAQSQQANGTSSARHWDDPGTQVSSIQYDDDPIKDDEIEVAMDVANDDEEEYDEEEESRELTHDEIWDDSVLIDAWNAANEEYEAIHGKGKNWKKDRLHKSPLWYNIPPESKKTKNKGKAKETANNAPSQPVYDNDSTPLDFHSYIPTHDASLHSVSALKHDASPLDKRNMRADARSSHFDPIYAVAPDETLSTDEAFSRAMSAMYWCGYWTAVYHTQRRLEAPAADRDDEEAIPEEELVEAEELVATQR